MLLVLIATSSLTIFLQPHATLSPRAEAEALAPSQEKKDLPMTIGSPAKTPALNTKSLQISAYTEM